jgi:hypothetical protein
MSKKQTTPKKVNAKTSKKSLDKIFKPIPNNPVLIQQFPDLKEALPGESEPSDFSFPSFGEIIYWRKSKIISKNISTPFNLSLSVIVTDKEEETFEAFFNQPGTKILFGSNYTKDPITFSEEYTTDKERDETNRMKGTIVLLNGNKATVITGPWFFDLNSSNPDLITIPSLIAGHFVADNVADCDNISIVASLTNTIYSSFYAVADYLYPQVQEETAK